MGTLDLGAILVDGTILSLVSGIYVMGPLYFKPCLLMHNYPKEIQARMPPLDRGEKRLETICEVILLVSLVGILPLLGQQVKTLNGDGLSFVGAFVNIYLLCLFFNLFDLLVLDYLIVVVWKPGFTILPGCESLAYLCQNMAYHGKASSQGWGSASS
jgi:hypothetical protein